ncbi:ABC transporter substrate-binding protein [Rhodobacterales bacterium 52_120_T64]|nr:ABC transporter substrate-binding protein [Rhodobacterales bacterium 52_120_T64]
MRFAHIASSLIFLAFGPHLASAFEVEGNRIYAAPNGNVTLKIISTADINVFEPIILEFQRAHPTINIDYVIASSTELMKAIYEEDAVFDLAISSAMDLQTKLANDGNAQAYSSNATDTLPDWAKWRNQIFAFTQEPAVVVISEAAFQGIDPPKTREELISLLRDNPDKFENRVGTYDVRVSGAGYLFATQDSRNSDSYWRLTEVMGRLNTRLYRGSGDMISDVASGRLALAYNVVGSYAISRLADYPGIRIILFDDYVNVMLRTALIPRNAVHPTQSGMMIDFLATLNHSPELTKLTSLPPIDSAQLQENSAARPIRLGPGLLVFLDRLKKENFLANWVNSIEQE